MTRRRLMTQALSTVAACGGLALLLSGCGDDASKTGTTSQIPPEHRPRSPSRRKARARRPRKRRRREPASNRHRALHGEALREVCFRPKGAAVNSPGRQPREPGPPLRPPPPQPRRGDRRSCRDHGFCRPFGAAEGVRGASFPVPGLTPRAMHFRPFGAKSRRPFGVSRIASECSRLRLAFRPWSGKPAVVFFCRRPRFLVSGSFLEGGRAKCRYNLSMRGRAGAAWGGTAGLLGIRNALGVPNHVSRQTRPGPGWGGATARFHPDRAPGGHRHHRGSGRADSAGRAGGAARRRTGNIAPTTSSRSAWGWRITPTRSGACRSALPAPGIPTPRPRSGRDGAGRAGSCPTSSNGRSTI